MKDTKRSQLISWCKNAHTFYTHDVIHWGNTHYYNRALRTAQELCQEGILRRLSKEEKCLLGYKGREGIFAYVGNGNNS